MHSTPSKDIAEQGCESAVGNGQYTVQQGDCMASIAAIHGFFWKTLWDLPENAKLKEVRQNPNTLLPGDRVYIPEPRLRWEQRATNQRHSFVRKGVPSSLNVVVVDDEDKPIAHQPYTLAIDGFLFRGVTDGDGAVHHPIPPNAVKGVLRLGSGADQREYFLNLGHLDPIETISGMQGRLRNLGLYAGSIDGDCNAETVSALLLFQEKYRLSASGKYDDTTQSKLREVSGC
jgi:N-acetylmuramoyl-L-alanine amidase